MDPSSENSLEKWKSSFCDCDYPTKAKVNGQAPKPKPQDKYSVVVPWPFSTLCNLKRWE